MKVTLWKELSDVQAEKTYGGAGIGQDVSSIIHQGQDIADSYGEKNLNQALRNGTVIYVPDPSVKNLGQAVKDIVNAVKS
jgi:hypothetical protein